MPSLLHLISFELCSMLNLKIPMPNNNLMVYLHNAKSSSDANGRYVRGLYDFIKVPAVKPVPTTSLK